MLIHFINDGLLGYTLRVNWEIVSEENLNVLTVNFYDDYKFLDLNTISNIKTALSYDINEHADFRTMYGSLTDMVAHKGKLTGTIVKMLENNTLLYSAFYYDYRGRVIQSKSTNQFGKVEKEYVAYDFIGNPVKRVISGSANLGGVTREEYEYEYDHAGRHKKTTHKLNSATTAKTIVTNTYDEAGRLNTSKGGNTNTITYSYDVRSRLKTINSTYFVQELTYTYGSNVETMKWRNELGTGYTDSYTFGYDKLSRLLTANHTNVTSGATGTYNESFTYDKHGNILTLTRNSKNTLTNAIVTVNNLTMTYNGNQSKRTVDNANYIGTVSDEYFFRDWYPFTTIDYTYNTNGAMIKDENKGLAMSYNILNLPKNVLIYNPVVTNGRINYQYSADGVKRKVIHTWSNLATYKPDVISEAIAQHVRGGEEDDDEKDKEKEDDENETRGNDEKYIAAPINSKTTDYVGNRIYVNGFLDKILLPNGYISGGNYYFYIADFLLNNRAVIRESDNYVAQRVDYYPGSGLPMQGRLSPAFQPYKHQGKEFDTNHGLNQTDHRNRYLDHATNRYTTPDRFAEKFPWQSPYVHAGNNAATYIDVNGDSVWIEHRKERILYEDGNLYNADGSEYSGKALKTKKDGTTKLTGFVGSTKRALDQIASGKAGNHLISELQSSEYHFTISSGEKNTFEFDDWRGATLGAGSGGNITWSRSSTSGGPNALGRTSRPAYIGLAHELGHAFHSAKGNMDPTYWFTVTTENSKDNIYNTEKQAIHWENQVRVENGLPLRTHYQPGYPESRVVRLGQSLYYNYQYYNILRPNYSRTLRGF